jgi:phosphatidylglycerol:prolipoprotein diacylglycerol transferase
MSWWNHIPEHINPNIIEFGSFRIRYYGLMYIVAFAITYVLVMYRIKSERYQYSKAIIQKYFVWAILGTLIGGRLGFVLFYDLTYYIAHPVRIISPFEYSNGIKYIGLSGMSYHGGLIGIISATLLFCHKNKINFWRLADLFAPVIALGFTFGRIGNFLNGELYGRVTTVPWAMYFPLDASGQLRHPSQLYEALFEGILLFVILWNLRKKQIFDGFHFCSYIIGYGTVRFFIEFVREPNPGLDSIFNFFTMGQVLCLAMIVSGIFIILIKNRIREADTKQLKESQQK